MPTSTKFSVNKFSEKGVIHLLVPLILLLGIIAGVYLVQKSGYQIFKPKAANPPIVFKHTDGTPIPVNDKNIPSTTKSIVRIELTSTLGPPQPATPSPIPTSTPSPTASPSSQARVFVTSTTYNGDLGGLSGADGKCQERANAANLGGTWKAWLSDSTSQPSSRFIKSDLPYKLINGTTVANNWTDLTDETLLVPINITENGSTISNTPIWTDTDFSGNRVPPGIDVQSVDCNNWTSSTNSHRGVVGSSTSTDGSWTFFQKLLQFNQYCDTSRPLYCFEQTGMPTETSTPTPTPSISPTQTFTVSYKLAETPTGLSSAPVKPYTAEPTVIPEFSFGVAVDICSKEQKFIWVEFIGSDGITDRRSGQIEITGPCPSATPTPSPTSAGGTTTSAGPFSFTLSNSQTTLTCKTGDANCKYTTILTATNKIDKTLHQVTRYKVDPANTLSIPNTQVVVNDQVAPGQTAHVVETTFAPPANAGKYYATLYLDGKICNPNTTPPDCVFFGASSLDFSAEVGATDVKITVVNNSPVVSSPSPTHSPTPIPLPSPTSTAKTPPCEIYGDLNLDGTVTNADVDLASKVASGEIIPSVSVAGGDTQHMRSVGDVNSDNKVDTTDVNLISRYADGLDSTFPVCQQAKLPPANCNNTGDVTTDGKVTPMDAYEVSRIVVGYKDSLYTKKPYTDDQKKRADVDGNGNVTSTDALRILRYIKGMDQTFKVCSLTTPTPTPTSTSAATTSTCTACRADINKSGGVDIGDFSRLVMCFNRRSTDTVRGTSCSSADINGDGSVNGTDYSCLRSQFGKRC